MDITKLKEIGLTDGEIRVYNALIRLGETTKSELAKQSEVSQSKVYEVANRLVEKGLVSRVKKDNTYHFKAATPERLLDFIEKKENEIKNEKETVLSMLPALLQQFEEHEEELDVEVFYGWKGMKTAYGDIAKSLGKGDVDYTFGASMGKFSEQADRHFNWYYAQVQKKKFKTKIIFNENVRSHKDRTRFYEKSPLHEVRYIDNNTFAEINFYNNVVLFILLLRKPVVIRITSKEAADSCKNYFNVMWGIAKG